MAGSINIAALLDSDDEDAAEAQTPIGAPSGFATEFAALRNRITGGAAGGRGSPGGVLAGTPQPAPNPAQPQQQPPQLQPQQQRAQPIQPSQLPQQLSQPQQQQQAQPQHRLAVAGGVVPPQQAASPAPSPAGGAPSAAAAQPVASAANVTVKELLDWLMPRLDEAGRTEMLAAQTEYRRTAANDPGAKAVLIKRIHQIGGRENILRFHTFKNTGRAMSPGLASNGPATPPAGSPGLRVGSPVPGQLPQPHAAGTSHLAPAQQAPRAAATPAKVMQVLQNAQAAGQYSGTLPLAALVQQQPSPQPGQQPGQQGMPPMNPQQQAMLAQIQAQMRAALQPGQQAGATAQQHRTVSTTAAATPPAAGAAPAKPPLQQPQQQKAGPEREADPTDVLAGTGIDMEAEAAALTANVGLGAANSMAGPSAAAAPAVPPDATLFGQDALLALLAGFAPRHAVRSVEPGAHSLLATALRSHLAGLLGRLAGAARHRASAARRPAGAAPGRDLRREVLAIEKRERVAAEMRAKKEREALLQAAASRSKAADEETREKLQKAKQDESERLQQIAANQALQSATGAAGKWANWGKKKGGAAGDKAGGKAGAGAKADNKRERETSPSSAAAENAKQVRQKTSEGAAAAAGSPAGGASTPQPGNGGTPAPALLQNGAAAATAAPPAAANGPSPTAAVTPAPARRAIANDGSVEVQLRDLVALLERDPHYAKSPLVYQLLEADGL